MSQWRKVSRSSKIGWIGRTWASVGCSVHRSGKRSDIYEVISLLIHQESTSRLYRDAGYTSCHGLGLSLSGFCYISSTVFRFFCRHTFGTCTDDQVLGVFFNVTVGIPLCFTVVKWHIITVSKILLISGINSSGCTRLYVSIEIVWRGPFLSKHITL